MESHQHSLPKIKYDGFLRNGVTEGDQFQHTFMRDIKVATLRLPATHCEQRLREAAERVTASEDFEVYHFVRAGKTLSSRTVLLAVASWCGLRWMSSQREASIMVTWKCRRLPCWPRHGERAKSLNSPLTTSKARNKAYIHLAGKSNYIHHLHIVCSSTMTSAVVIKPQITGFRWFSPVLLKPQVLLDSRGEDVEAKLGSVGGSRVKMFLGTAVGNKKLVNGWRMAEKHVWNRNMVGRSYQWLDFGWLRFSINPINMWMAGSPSCLTFVVIKWMNWAHWRQPGLQISVIFVVSACNLCLASNSNVDCVFNPKPPNMFPIKKWPLSQCETASNWC